ncbi:hypothetical protein C8J56DRAFT_1028407 [Mycena floridula]|nr:hypothetical protein C8J56DRAFT_1028407 [Mycena floridula]
MDNIQQFFRGLVPNNRETTASEEPAVVEAVAVAESSSSDVQMDTAEPETDDGMPDLQDVSDSSNDEFEDSDLEMDSDGDSDNDEPTIPINPPRSNRRVRVESDQDEDRDRRHPSQRVAPANNNNNNNNNNNPPTLPALPGLAGLRTTQLPPPPPPSPAPAAAGAAPRARLNQGMFGTVLSLDFGMGPFDGGVPGVGAGGQPAFVNGGDFADMMAQLTAAMGMYGEPEVEDPERAKTLVAGLEEVPVGLVKRLERVGDVGGAEGESGASGGDSGCAICWDKLLDGDGDQFGKTETTDTLPKIVALPCAHVFHASCLIPWFSRPRQTTCPTCRFNIDPENLTYVRPARPAPPPAAAPTATTGATEAPAPPATAEAPALGPDAAAPAPEAAQPPPVPTNFSDLLRSLSQHPGVQTTIVPIPINANGQPMFNPLPFPLVPRQAPVAPQAAPVPSAADPLPQPAPAPTPTAVPPPVTPAERLSRIGEQMSNNLNQPAPGKLSFFMFDSIFILSTAPPRDIGLEQNLGDFAHQMLNSIFGAGARNIQTHIIPDNRAFPGPFGNAGVFGNAPFNMAPAFFQPLNVGQAPPAPTPGDAAPGRTNDILTFGIDLVFGAPAPMGDEDEEAGEMDEREVDAIEEQLEMEAERLSAGDGEEFARLMNMLGGNPDPIPEDDEDDLPPPLIPIVPGPAAAATSTAETSANPAPPVTPIPPVTAGSPSEFDSGFLSEFSSSGSSSARACCCCSTSSGLLSMALSYSDIFGISSLKVSKVLRFHSEWYQECLEWTGPSFSRPHSRRTGEKKKWTLPAAPGPTLRQRIERREREAGLRCHDMSCGIGPSDEDPLVELSDDNKRQLPNRLPHETASTETPNACSHTFHPSCLVSAQRVALRGAEEKVVGDDVEISCPVCKADGVVLKAEWADGVLALA